MVYTNTLKHHTMLVSTQQAALEARVLHSDYTGAESFEELRCIRLKVNMLTGIVAI